MDRKNLGLLLTGLILILAVFLGMELVGAGRTAVPADPIPSQTQAEGLPPDSAEATTPEQTAPHGEPTAPATEATEAAPAETVPEETKPAEAPTEATEAPTEETTGSTLPPNMLPIG